METASIRRNRPAIVRIAAAALTLGALLLGQVGNAAASVELPLRNLVTSISTDVDARWADIFADNDVPYTSPDLVLVSSTVESACGTVDKNALETYCTADTTIYLGSAALREVRQDHGDFGVAVLVADAYGFSIIDQLGMLDEPGIDVSASCLAGVWAWYADRDGELYPEATDDGVAFYEATFQDGETLGEAFLTGYNTDVINDCFPSTQSAEPLS